MNLTIGLNESSLNIATQPLTQKGCFDWCVLQHVTGYNNIELGSVILIAVALLMLFIAEWCNESAKYKEHSGKFIYFAKLMIYIFFFVYFFVIRLRLYYYMTGG